VIVFLADKETERLASGFRVRRFAAIETVARRKLRQLEISCRLEDLNVPPGNRLEALKAEPERFGELLPEIDLLIDGEYRADLAGMDRWRGSSNQKLHSFTGRIQLDNEYDQAREVQLTLDPAGSGMVASGVMPEGLLEELRRQLASRGFESKRVSASLAGTTVVPVQAGCNQAPPAPSASTNPSRR
jgi:hypothetical protein